MNASTTKEPAPEALRAHFEALASDPSFKLSRSRRGTYVNPAVARDWKWFQLGASQSQQTAPAGTPDCDTPNYCSSVQRCTAQDEQRSRPAPQQEAQEPAFWMNEKGHTWSHSDWKQFPKHRAKYPIPLYPHLPAPQPSTAQAASQEPVASAGAVDALPDEKTCVDYALQYGGRCRDCADENGVCPGSGLPCSGARKAVTHVVKALRYGLQHGYLRAAQVEVKP